MKPRRPGSKTAVITGCDYGLGVELARTALRQGYRVFAGCLKPEKAKTMKELRLHGAPLELLKLDTGSEASIRRACSSIARRTGQVHVLVNCAATYWRDNLETIDFRKLGRMMAVNAFGPVCLVRRLRSLLRAARGAVIVNISSEAGSMSNVANSRPIYSYAASKSALNMFTRRMSFELEKDKVRVFCIHPGWMRTPMGFSEGNPVQHPADTAHDVFRLIASPRLALTGCFFWHHGKRFPW